MRKIKQLDNWIKAAEQIKDYFVLMYYGKGDHDSYWIADEVGGVFFINDNFYSVNDMVDFLIANYTEKQMFEYYDYRLDAYQKNGMVINIRNYKLLKNDKERKN